MSFQQWSKTASANSTADPTINWAEGMAPSTINDDGRAMMARLAEYRDDVSGVLVTAGTSTAYTLASNEGIASVPTDGQKLSFRPHATNGAAATLTVDGGTTYPIQTAPAAGVADSVMTLGAPYTVVFRTASTAWILADFYGTSGGTSYTSVFSFMTGAEITNIVSRVGNIDVSSKVQTAINSLSEGTLFFPSGVYLFGNVTLKAGVEILGSGRESTYVKAMVNNAQIFGYASAGPVSNFNISNMSFDANGFTGVRGISIDGGIDASKRCSYVNISDCFFKDCDTAVFRRFNANSFLSNLHAIGGVNGFWQDTCADTDMVNLRSQLGTGVGFRIKKIIITNDHSDEGTRLSNCATNGTATGFWVTDAQWGSLANCSFSTCSAACAVFDGIAANWTWNGGEASSGSFNTGITVSSGAATRIGLNNLTIALNNIGVALTGNFNSCTNCKFASNLNDDLTLNGGFSVVTGNTVDSAPSGAHSAFSLVETGGNFNIISNNVTHGLCTVTGPNSLATNNIQSYP